VHYRWSRKTLALVATPVLAAAGMAVFAAGPATAHVTARASAPRSVAPNRYNMLDCNGWSKAYKSVNPGFRRLCVDPRGRIKGSTPWVVGGGYSARGRFVDNGHYVGHDEPSVKFISSAANSGNTMTYYMKLPVDPGAPATNDGSVVDYGELSPAPWFGLPICDPGSYPQNPCKPDSDSNIGLNMPKAAGSAFSELQFYPPKFAPFADSLSCSATFWCAAMTIDSLESKFNFNNLNLGCVEPVNFAYLQDNGKPAGPPSPQKTDFATFTPNSHTLQMHFGDLLKVSISDPAKGFTTTVTDLTTHKTGTMTASAGNGFMNTNYKNCRGTPHTFHAEFNTARKQNQVPWAALEGGVLMEQEIGHSEVCSSLANADPFNNTGVSDPNTMATCVGGSEGQAATGEGPCNFQTGVCQGATTEGTTGPIACPSNNFGSPELCEYSDGTCLPQGSRPVMLNGVPGTETSPVNFCENNQTQNGDLDFDGTDYQTTTWPNGSANVPTSIRYVGPFTNTGQAYPKIQFETDAAGSEFLCNIFTGLNCDAPPLAAAFYPFWTLTSTQGIGPGLFHKGACVWNFGNDIAGVTTKDFGKDAQYGVPDVAQFGGTIITPSPINNPEVSGKCPVLTNPKK
jgi:hypothetical protein